MKHIDQQQLDNIWLCLHSNVSRDLILYFKSDGAFTYTEIQKHLFRNYDTVKTNGMVAYHIKHLMEAGIITKDVKQKRYHLTRIGVRSLELIKEFNDICTRYDMDDVAADGKLKIETKVIGRKI